MAMVRVKHYRIKRKIGSGGMATVYEAIDEHIGTTVALKILHPHLADQPTYVKRFSREAQVAMNLHSPHIARVLDSGRDTVDGDTVYYIAMEYIPGVTLTQLMRNGSIFSVAQVMNIAYQVAQALAEANRHGIVHRDIKPQNIMITPEGVVKVMDFGIARETLADSLTKTGMFVGTPQYSSPEQALGKKDVDIRSDIYSLGVVLYQLLTGIVPFQADTPQALLNRVARGNPVPVESHRINLPPEVSAIVNKMLQREPRNRFQSPEELIEALHPLIGPLTEGDEATTIVAPGSKGHAKREKRNELLTIGSGLMKPLLSDTVRNISILKKYINITLREHIRRIPIETLDDGCTPVAIAVDRNDNAYLWCDCQAQRGCIQKFSKDAFEPILNKNVGFLGHFLHMTWEPQSSALYCLTYEETKSPLSYKVAVHRVTDKIDDSVPQPIWTSTKVGVPRSVVMVSDNTIWIGSRDRNGIWVINADEGTINVEPVSSSEGIVAEDMTIVKRAHAFYIFVLTKDSNSGQKAICVVSDSGLLGVGKAKFGKGAKLIRAGYDNSYGYSRFYLGAGETTIRAYTYVHEDQAVRKEWSETVKGFLVDFAVGRERLFALVESDSQYFLDVYNISLKWWLWDYLRPFLKWLE